MRFFSTADVTGEIIDRRMLCIEGNFYLFSTEEAIALALDWSDFITNHFENDFIIRSSVSDDRRSGKGKSIKEKILSLQDKRSLFVDIEGVAVGKTVYNKKTYNEYRRWMSGLSFSFEDSISVDYREEFVKLFLGSEKLTTSSVKRNTLELFRIPGKKNLGVYEVDFDLQAAVMCSPYSNKQDAVYGKASICLSTHSCGNELDEMAKVFADLAVDVSEKFKKINMLVTVSSRAGTEHCSPHMQYFWPTNRVHDESHLIYDCDPFAWYKTYYLHGVEWFNIISPATAKMLTNLEKGGAEREGFSVERLGNSWCVRSLKPISELDVFDLYPMKDFLYPALQPGEKSIPMGWFLGMQSSWFPRESWELLPLYENEIEVKKDRVVFRCGNTGTDSACGEK